MFKFLNKGFTLIEIMVALGMMTAVAYFLLNYIDSIEKEKSQLLKLKNLQDVITTNVSMLKGTASTKYPAHGNCIVKIYTLAGKYISETIHAITSSQCTTLDTNNDSIKCIIGFKNYDDIKVNYTPSAFLKLPKYSQKIYEINIQGIYKSKEFTEKLGLTIIKR